MGKYCCKTCGSKFSQKSVIYQNPCKFKYLTKTKVLKLIMETNRFLLIRIFFKMINYLS